MKKRLSLIYLFLLFIFTFNSCQTEENLIKSESSSNNRFTTKRISISEITNSEVSSKISRLQERNQINYTSKVVYDSINNFYIDTDNGMYIMDENGVESYTFSIYSENSLDSLENLVVMVYPEGDTKVFIADYDKTFTEINNLSENEMINYSVNFTEIDLENGTEGQRVLSCIEILVWDKIDCNQNEADGGEINCYGWVILYSSCSGGSSGVGGDSGYSGGGSSGSGGHAGAGGGSSSSGSGSSTGSNGSILTTPLDDSDLGITYYQIKRQKWLNTQFNLQQYGYLNNNPDAKNSIIDYLESTITANDQETYSLENVEFVKELIDLVFEHNIEIIDTYQGNYSVFNNLSEVEDFLTYEEIDNTISNSNNFEQDKKITNRTIKLNSLVDLNIELVTNPNPNFSIDEENCNTDITTFFPGVDWVQQSIVITNSNLNGDNNNAEINISGYILVGIEIGDYKKGIKHKKHIILRVNKNTGQIYYSEVKNIN